MVKTHHKLACTEPCLDVQTVSCPQQSLENQVQESSPCASSQSQPAFLTQADNVHYDGSSTPGRHHHPAGQVHLPYTPETCVPKKAGRPVTYQGDINSPTLSSSERCCIKHRIVNREAARRLRERQQGALSEAQTKVTELKQHNRKLKGDLQERKALQKALQGELKEAQSQWSEAAADHVQLQAEVHSLRRSLEVSLLMLEKETQPSQPALSGTPSFMSPQGVDSLAEYTLSYEVVQPSPLLTFAPSLTARESLPSQWTSALAGQFPQGSMGSPRGFAGCSMGSIGSTPCFTGSAGGTATLRDLLISQSCQEAVSSCYQSGSGASCSPTPMQAPQLPRKGAHNSNAAHVRPMQRPSELLTATPVFPSDPLTATPMFSSDPLTATPMSWHHNFDAFVTY